MSTIESKLTGNSRIEDLDVVVTVCGVGQAAARLFRAELAQQPVVVVTRHLPGLDVDCH